MVPTTGSTDLNEVDPESSVFSGHSRQFGLCTEASRVRTEFVTICVVKGGEVILGLAPRARISSGNSVVPGGAQQVRMGVKVVTGTSRDQHEASQCCPALQRVIDDCARRMWVCHVLRFSEFRPNRWWFRRDTRRTRAAWVATTSRNSHPTTVRGRFTPHQCLPPRIVAVTCPPATESPPIAGGEAAWWSISRRGVE